jgi:hypothetical protein
VSQGDDSFAAIDAINTVDDGSSLESDNVSGVLLARPRGLTKHLRLRWRMVPRPITAENPKSFEKVEA